MPDICHFEIPSDSVDRAREFYGELFGWTFQELSLGDSPYWQIKTGGQGPSGGLLGRQNPGHRWMNYISVDSLKAYVLKATGLGAKVIVPETLVPGMGRFAILEDQDGNRFGLWEVDPGVR
ncbi:VOC family protein [bacterium]|nr:VOC family protein [bacterium]